MCDCQVRCGEDSAKTDVKEKTTTPAWKSELVLGLKKPLSAEIFFKVYGYNRLIKDENLGEVRVALATLAANDTTCGELSVEVRYEPDFVLDKKPSFMDSLSGSLPSLAPMQPQVTSSPRTGKSPASGEEAKAPAPAGSHASLKTQSSGAVGSQAPASAPPSSNPPASNPPGSNAPASNPPASDNLGKLERQQSGIIAPPNCVVVTVLEGRNLIACDGSGETATSDPFVKVKLPGMRSQKTKVQKKTLNPRWRQIFYFPYGEKTSKVLEIQVEDDDLLSNDFLGLLTIDLEDWRRRFDIGKKTMWLALESKVKGDEQQKFTDLSPERSQDLGRGKLCLSIEMRYAGVSVDKLEQGAVDHDTPIPSSKPRRSLPPSSSQGAGAGEAAQGEEEAEGGEQYVEDDGDEEDAPEKAEDAPKSKESEEEAKKREEERQKMFSELNDVQFLSGDYQIQVRIIEVRDLKPMDLNGLCDPVVAVDCLGHRQHTMVKQNQLSCVFDEYLYFNFKNLDRETVQQASIKISVLDADGPSRLIQTSSALKMFSDTIGFFVVDIPYVYFQKNHEIHRRWVALVGNTSANSDSIQGYLLLSIVVLGPGDKLKIHDASKEAPSESLSGKDINSLVLIPPRVSQTLHFLVVTIHCAQDLPDMDSTLVKSGGIDAYVRVSFGGQDVLQSKPVTVKGSRNLAVDFNQELWFPVLLPTMSNNVFISLWDYDTVSDELVANVEPVSFAQVQKYPTQFKTQWRNLYGPPVGVKMMMESKAMKYMFDHPAAASTYRGRVLISLRVEPGSKSINDRPHIRNLMSVANPPLTKPHTLRSAIFYGTEIPMFTSKTNWNRNSKMALRVSIGSHEVRTTRVDNTAGVCKWHQYVDLNNITLPADLENVPDVFVHIVREQLGSVRLICYGRFKAKDLFIEGFDTPMELCKVPQPQWVTLIEDPVLDDLKDEEFTGNILMSLRLEPAQPDAVEKEVARSWREKASKGFDYTRYTLLAHVFQGRGLPAADANGLLDPYIKISCSGAEEKVSKRLATRDPCYYESVALEIDLPQDEECLPKVSLQVFDWDQWDSDDYVGCVKFSLSSFPQMTSNEYDQRKANGTYAPPLPQWYPIQFLKPGDTEGELLVSFDLIRKSDPGAIVEPPESIRPAMEEKFIEIICLGCRGLQPVGFMPVNSPFVKFEIGEVTKTNAAKFTNPSSKPSGRNPNFLERIIVPVKMPVDALFAPRLNITVYDQLLGGFYKPTLGVCSVDLCSKLPTSNGAPNPNYVAPGGHTHSGNPYLERPADLSTFPGSKLKLDVDTGSNPAESTNPPEPEEEAADNGAGAIPPASNVSSQYVVDEDEDEVPHYLQNREILDHTLEETLGRPPFESYTLFRGDMLKRRGKTSDAPADYRSVGRFKGMIRILKSRDEPPLFDMEQFLNPQPYLIRIYVLDAFGVQPKDENNKCDPYLRLSIGDGRKRQHMINDRDHHKKETLAPKFHKMYELKAQLPGASDLLLEMYDYDFFAMPFLPVGKSHGVVQTGTTIGGDDFVGSTIIDLEDRLFSKKWQALGTIGESPEKRKPVELRPLFAPSSTLPQGNMRLWVDILTPLEMAVVKPLDISLPPREKFEVRVIVYKAKNVTAGDAMTDLSDLFIKCWLQAFDDRAQTTDIHWRAKDGKASFNWRMKFDLELPVDKDSELEKGYLHLQMWDKDLVYDDCLADSIVDLSSFLKQAYKTKQIVNVFAKKKMVRIRGVDGVQSAPTSTATGYAASEPPTSARTTEYGPSSASSAYDTYGPQSTSSAVSIDMSENDEDPSKPLLGSNKGAKAGKKTKKKAADGKEGAESLVRSIKHRLGMGDDPEDASWLTFTTRDATTGDRIEAGKLLVSIEVLPKAIAEARAAGLGRSEPNNFPFLAEPADRLHLSAMWNPLYVMEAMLGPKVYRAFSSFVTCVVLVGLLVFAGPLVNVFVTILEMMPQPYGWVVFGVLVALVMSSICYCSYRCRRAISSDDDDE
ncbi:TPA: hypothetical protein N0F65_003692 [Lagenidium giganteum]|uniref:C2 domain-containing protein n=1 Tax=Lagenidium giganteum TaxID=4803 RepID=A0AAV2YVR2_9STRA|nr:TPA: hypothetical protein N0F65_003692 [Lagenidium giganteum]